MKRNIMIVVKWIVIIFFNLIYAYGVLEIAGGNFFLIYVNGAVALAIFLVMDAVFDDMIDKRS